MEPCFCRGKRRVSHRIHVKSSSGLHCAVSLGGSCLNQPRSATSAARLTGFLGPFPPASMKTMPVENGADSRWLRWGCVGSPRFIKRSRPRKEACFLQQVGSIFHPYWATQITRGHLSIYAEQFLGYNFTWVSSLLHCIMVADEYPKKSSESDAPKWYLQFFENYQPLWGMKESSPQITLKVQNWHLFGARAL